MTRKYSLLTNDNARQLLDVLVAPNTAPQEYQRAMVELGEELGTLVLTKIHSPQSKIYLACTAEDADFLAKGILDVLEKNGFKPPIACFWNQRSNPFNAPGVQVAPIVQRYKEPSDKQIDLLIVVKSIVSGACVVKTNLKYLIQEIEPQSILIVAPVMHSGAEQKLKDEFDRSVYEKFEFLYFAQDDERKLDGEVVPGVGGMVYDRLGFDGQDGKNRHMPKIVNERMEQQPLSA
jgi:hypothetical protein